ncbi:MAG: hypothetical protein E7306_04330 [Butyrivibrio sp.]|nr:hypothetical protein [Butyrivibrio sp.]
MFINQRTITTISILLMLGGVSLITGCGSSKVSNTDVTTEDVQEVLQEEFGEDLSEEDANLLASTINEIADSSTEAQSAEEIKEDEPKVYPPADEWRSTSVDDRYIQICDVLLAPGYSVDDIMKKIGESELELTYDYNPEALTSAHRSGNITIKYHMKDWLTIDYINPTKEVGTLKDAIVYYIYPREEAKETTRYIDGRNLSDMSSLTYQDVKSLSENIFKGYIIQESTDFTGNLVVKYLTPYTSNFSSDKSLDYTKGNVPNVEEAFGYYFTYPLWYVFYIDPNTNQVVNFEISHLNSVSFNESKTSSDDNKEEKDTENNDTNTANNNSTDKWGDTEVTEYVDDEYGIHFYLPSDLTVTVKGPLYNWGIVNRSYYVTGRGMKDEYLCQTQKCSDEVHNDSDPPEDELHGEIAHKDGYHYSINFINPETQYDFTLSSAMIEFMAEYRQKILDSAWVE